MIDAKVYLIKSDIKTECHCGHQIHEGDEYYMLRTSIPKWISLCTSCVSLLGSPSKINMRELVDYYFSTQPDDGKGIERKNKTINKKVNNYTSKKSEQMLIDEMKAEWI